MPVIFDGPEFQIIETASAAGFTRTLVPKTGSPIANQNIIVAKAAAAIVANSAFLGLIATTPAQQLAQLRLLTRENTATIRLLLGLLDNAADTDPDTDPGTAVPDIDPRYQLLDADLTSIAAVSTTGFGRGMLGLADAPAGRSALGLGTAATHATGDYLPFGDMIQGTVDPWTGAGVAALIGTLHRNTVTGVIHTKTGASDTAWEGLSRFSGAHSALSGLAANDHPQYDLPVHTNLANDTLAMALGTNTSVRLTVTAARTLTTTVPAAGRTRVVLILTSGASSFVITFGSGFKPTATLATGTVTARVFAISFISDGTNLYETSRTVAMVA